MELKKYSRKIAKKGPKKLQGKTVNLSAENSKKITKLDVFLSRIIQDYIDSKDYRYLTDNFSKDHFKVENNQNRVISSVCVRIDQLPKIQGVNMTALVNEVIEQL